MKIERAQVFETGANIWSRATDYFQEGGFQQLAL
jgi:hypothetical protein